MSKSTPKLHKIPAAAEALGISRKQVYRLIDAGEIIRVKIGAAARITDESLTAYVARRIAASEIVPVVPTRVPIQADTRRHNGTQLLT